MVRRPCKVLDIGPGQMLSWQLNAPHRVENLGTFSVSMTVSYDERRDPPHARSSISPTACCAIASATRRRAATCEGPSFFAKAVMQKLLRDTCGSSASAGAHVRSSSGSITAYPGKIVDLPKAA